MATVTIEQALQVALTHHQAGRLAEAEGIYRQILAQNPNHADALHLLGIIAHQAGRYDVAVNLIRQAIEVTPNVSAFHSNLAHAHRMMGGWEEAAAAYRRALELQPDDADLANTLGNVLVTLGRADEAIAAYRRALEMRPDFVEARSNLGNMFSTQGRTEEAIAEYRRALELRPDSAAILSNLGNALREMGLSDEAIAACRRALDLEPNDAVAWNNLGNALRECGLPDEAMAAYDRALELLPTYAEAQSNLGVALGDQGRLEDAMAAYRRAIELNPSSVVAHTNLGALLSEQGRQDEAIDSCHRALALQPDDVAALYNLGLALMESGRLDEALAMHGRALALRPRAADIHSGLLLGLHYRTDLSSEAILTEHRLWDERHAAPLARFIQPQANDREPMRRLRIGYISPDFRDHSVAYFLEGLLAGHDPSQVEVFCYSDVRRADAVTARLRQQAAQWREIAGRRDAEVAGLIRADQIDILVDLAGHTARNRLLVFARKPAPVQVSWQGYCDTTGLQAMDCRITDALADPPGTSEHLSTERLVRLPAGAWCYRPSADTPPVDPPPVLQSGSITFGSFNALSKINDQVLALWSAILQQVPGSRLLLKTAAFLDPAVQARTQAWLEKAGIAAERVTLLGRVSAEFDHLALYGRMDIALDTFPYNGTTTTCEALWMGVPVVTLAGQIHAARVGSSLLTQAGLPEIIAITPAEYIRLAVNLAGDLPRLSALRSTQRERMSASPLMDAPRFARDMEHAYREMWRAWCAGTRA